MTKFFDAHVRPPKSGWHYPIAGEHVEKHSETEILDALRRWRQNNGTFVSEEALKAELWQYYCSREPERCGLKAGSVVSAAAVAPRELTPEVMGPWIWQFLNLAAVRWVPGLHDWFLSLCDAIIVILECPKCRDEWRRLLAENPPAGLNSRLSICQWVNAVHNEVNVRNGKHIYPYSRMVDEYGAPLA